MVQANWLRKSGVKKGDIVCIYMPMICHLPIVMLACARIGAVHSVVFGGFSSEALCQRIVECRSPPPSLPPPNTHTTTTTTITTTPVPF